MSNKVRNSFDDPARYVADNTQYKKIFVASGGYMAMSTPHKEKTPKSDQPPYSAELAKASEAYKAKAAAEAGDKETRQPTDSRQEEYTFLSAGDVLALKGEPWCVKDLLPASGLAAIFGQPGSGKTFVALDMAFSLAEGRDWFNIQTRACPVVYVNLESRLGLKKRLMAWQKEKRRLPENISFVIEPFHILKDVDRLARGIKQGTVIFLDTLNAAASGLDENSSMDMGKILEAAKKLQRLTDGLVVLVHHGGKDISKGLRGHSSLLAALDAVIEVAGTPEARFWKTTKLKEAECNTRRGFKLKAVDIGMNEDGEPETSCVVEPDDSAVQRKKPLSSTLTYALESLRETLKTKGDIGDKHGNVSVHLDEWRPIFYKGHPAANQKAKEKAFLRARKALVDAEVIDVNDDYYSLRQLETGDRQETDRRQTPSPNPTVQGDRRRHPPLGGVSMSPMTDGVGSRA